MNKRKLGSDYEAVAITYLEEAGVRIKQRNFNCRMGEIDIIGYDGDTLVFFEVKYRKSPSKGTPEEAVTKAKQRTISSVADFYHIRYKIPYDIPCRFDVIAILGDAKSIKWYKNAFEYCGRW